jgi:hypothetical protein
MDATPHQQPSAGTLVESAAQLALGQLRARVGEPGSAAMREFPGLLAMVDQHAASVRDALGGRIRPEDLAAYADGVSDIAASHGWTLDTALGNALANGWTSASWPLLRLLAVCALAESCANG